MLKLPCHTSCAQMQELRAAFLHYCKSSIKVSEMHLVHEGPFMAAQQFVQLCKDYKLLEPEGEDPVCELWVGVGTCTGWAQAGQ